MGLKERSPRVRRFVREIQKYDPHYKGPWRDDWQAHYYAYWIDGMSEETFQRYLDSEKSFAIRMQIRKLEMRMEEARTWGAREVGIDLNTNKSWVVNP